MTTATLATPTSAGRAATDTFGDRAPDHLIEQAADGLRAKGYAVHIVEDGGAARDLILELLPDGAEVGQGASTTLDQIGLSHELEESGRFDAVRKTTRSMDHSSPEGLRAMRKLGVGPDWYVNSAHALTLDGTIVVASNTGSQLAPLSFGAGEVIWTISSQKIVADLETAMRRIEDHVLPLESGRMQGLYGIDSEIKKVLIIHKEFRPGRFTVVLIKEPLGF
ncbi:MAG TPA: LUD domain-containing protein [Candidatus Limnocylindria bacterium]|nr:LUD domain-containing protein [Candidatus Limnocylindria bacterium]